MAPRWSRFILIFVTIALLMVGALFFLGREDELVLPEPPTNQKEKDIFAKARERFMLWRERGEDLSQGPCLGEIEKDWVVDIVHFPRKAEDDMPQNQCPEFLTGQLIHVIELSDNGDFINMK